MLVVAQEGQEAWTKVDKVITPINGQISIVNYNQLFVFAHARIRQIWLVDVLKNVVGF